MTWPVVAVVALVAALVVLGVAHTRLWRQHERSLRATTLAAHQRRSPDRRARELHDDVLQAVTLARYALEAHDHAAVAAALDDALRAARRSLLASAVADDLVRTVASIPDDRAVG